MNTPPIPTARLLLRPFTRDDAKDVYAYASNPNVARHCSWETHRSIADAESFIEMVLARGADELMWAICQVNNPTVIGAIEFSFTAPSDAQFHYVLDEPFWNRGLMTEAARAVVAWGLERYPMIRRLSTAAMTQNIGSQRVMEKCGLRLERTLMGKWDKFPAPVEERVYALVREQ